MESSQSNNPGLEPALHELLEDNVRIEELPSDDSNPDFEDVMDADEADGIPFPGGQTDSKHAEPADVSLPLWLDLTEQKSFDNGPSTTTTEAQAKVTNECLPFLTGEDCQGLEMNSHGVPRLRRQAHIEFLKNTVKALPAPYQVADAARPWFFYWALSGLAFLGEDVSVYASRLKASVKPLQNPTGGFGGGVGQLSHCACTYATILSLAAVGALDVVDRKSMWHWLGEIKQSDGGFRMAVDAEEDVRGAYCAMTIISILNLPLDLPPEASARKAGVTSFLDRLGEWVGRCQTYEGGIAGSPTNEAHGAYAFCALACLCIIDAPHVSIPRYLDVHALVSWLALRQTMAEGGFAGRQEKLVDACYGHWVGGCWDLIQAALPHSSLLVGDIWNREAMIRYLLCCAQQTGKKGGMRDKPSTRPDGYHTCYSIAGLGHAQNKYHYDVGRPSQQSKTGRLLAAWNWTARKASYEELKAWKIHEQDVVEFVHPVFVLPMRAVEEARNQFESMSF